MQNFVYFSQKTTVRTVDFKQRVLGIRPKICPISLEIGLGTRPAKDLKEALSWVDLKHS